MYVKTIIEYKIGRKVLARIQKSNVSDNPAWKIGSKEKQYIAGDIHYSVQLNYCGMVSNNLTDLKEATRLAEEDLMKYFDFSEIRKRVA